jgi:hypothetical protein
LNSPSKADIAASPTNVRFTPKSGHQNWPVSFSTWHHRQLGDIRRNPPRLVAWLNSNGRAAGQSLAAR